MRSITLLIATLLTLATPLGAQVSVGPTHLYLSADARFGTFFVSNRTGTTQEVTIGFRFGYPRTDSIGERFMVYGDTLRGAEYSMKPWTRAFPRQFLLPPGERQIVRLTILPRPGLREGVYWTRLVTTSMPRSAPVDTMGEGVAAQIIFKLEQITTVFYKHGAVATGVRAGPPEVAVDSARIRVLVPVERTGNAPFLGSARLRVYDDAGELVAERSNHLDLYYRATERFTLGRAALPAGEYTAEVRFVAERSDIPADDIVPLQAPLTTRLRFRVPER